MGGEFQCKCLPQLSHDTSEKSNQVASGIKTKNISNYPPRFLEYYNIYLMTNEIGQVWRNIKIILSPVYTLKNYSLRYIMPNNNYKILSQTPPLNFSDVGDGDYFIEIKMVLWGEPLV